jgi:hypothetical protein
MCYLLCVVGMMKSAEFRPSANHRHALDSAIGIRSSDTRQQPDLPRAVRAGTLQAGGSSIILNSMYGEGMGQFSHSHSQLGENSQSTMGSGIGGVGGFPPPYQQFQQQAHRSTGAGAGAGGGGGSPIRGGSSLEHGSFSSAYDADEVKGAIAERERHFFKEVSMNPNLKDQHPLMHLISAQQKLKLIDEQSGVLASKTANQAESVFGTRYGKQTNDTFKKNAAYAAEIPYAVNGEIILPSKLRARRQEELRKSKLSKSRSLKALTQRSGTGTGTGTDGDQSDAGSGAGRSHNSVPLGGGLHALSSNDPNAKSSMRHRDYLQEQLRRIESTVISSGAYAGHYSGSIDDKNATATATAASGSGAGAGAGAGGGGGGFKKYPSAQSPTPTAGKKSGFAAKKPSSMDGGDGAAASVSPDKSSTGSPGKKAPGGGGGGGGGSSRSPTNNITTATVPGGGAGGADAVSSSSPSLQEGSSETALLARWGVEAPGAAAAAGGSSSLAESSTERLLVVQETDALLQLIDQKQQREVLDQVANDTVASFVAVATQRVATPL